MEITDVTADVIVVGFGPTGLTLASLLGGQGHTVAVVERWPELYGKPRLTHIDGETARLLEKSSDVDEALRDSWVLPHYMWKSHTGQELLDVGAGNTQKMLWDDHITVHQPHIEDALLERVSSFPNVQLFRGYLASSINQDDSTVTLIARQWKKGDDLSVAPTSQIRVHGSYLVGADGSKSVVREAVGIERRDYGFNERWLCVDTEPLVPLPAKFDKDAIQICDPARGYMFMPIGKKRQRFEFALLPGERTEDMSTPEAALRLLKQYHDIDGSEVELVRVIVYTFECRVAETWTKGRVILAGDAAHTNPPYLGQGACSGMRDASNLAWKLDLILREVAAPSLLETYEQERKPHAVKLMLDARALGKLANTNSRFVAGIRDLVFRFNLAPTPVFPTLKEGVLARNSNGKIAAEVGSVPEQGHVMLDGEQRRLDEITGFDFVVLSRTDVLTTLSTGLQAKLNAIGVEQVVIGAAGVEDMDGVYGRLFERLGADVLVVRPDFVLYGYADKSSAEELLSQLVNAVTLRVGVASEQPLAA